MNSLLDVLYGCYECGCHGDYCECDNIEANDDEYTDLDQDQYGLQQQSPPTSPTVRSITPHVTSTSFSPPWTPPPTPPCINCGGLNYGPCPTDVCFGCIPPLTRSDTPPSCSSPSTTPPGSPPPFGRRYHQSVMKEGSSNQV